MSKNDCNAAAATQLDQVRHALARAAIALQSAYGLAEELQDTLDVVQMSIALAGLQLQAIHVQS